LHQLPKRFDTVGCATAQRITRDAGRNAAVAKNESPIQRPPFSTVTVLKNRMASAENQLAKNSVGKICLQVFLMIFFTH
jgi:hypothetical protein